MKQEGWTPFFVFFVCFYQSVFTVVVGITVYHNYFIIQLFKKFPALYLFRNILCKNLLLDNLLSQLSPFSTLTCYLFKSSTVVSNA
jgi:hypothetical protein